MNASIAPKRNWHAKIAVRLDKTGTPAAAIVGSSNLTGPAYAEGRSTWNYESDVTIWTPASGLGDYFRDDSEPTGDPFEQIIAKLSEDVRQPNEEERIERLLRDILSDERDFLPLDEYRE